MPFEGRTLRAASQACRERLNSLLSHTITRTPLIAIVHQRDDLVDVGFRQGGLSSRALLRTRYGPMNLYIGITFDAVEGQRARVRLRPIAYQYTLAPTGADEPLFRWEYVRFPASGSYWCRNHLQGPIVIDVGGRQVNLNDWHLPTGPVPIEEIIRFCLVDLGVAPLDASVDADGAPGWHGRLIESAGGDDR